MNHAVAVALWVHPLLQEPAECHRSSLQEIAQKHLVEVLHRRRTNAVLLCNIRARMGITDQNGDDARVAGMMHRALGLSPSEHLKDGLRRHVGAVFPLDHSRLAGRAEIPHWVSNVPDAEDNRVGDDQAVQEPCPDLLSRLLVVELLVQ